MPPTPADRATAEAFVAETYDADPSLCPIWLKTHRPALVRYSAVAAMQKREHAEWRAQTQGCGRDQGKRRAA